MDARTVLLGAGAAVAAGACALATYLLFAPVEAEKPPAPAVVFARGVNAADVESGSIWRMHPDGSGATMLARGRAPAISPDGHWVAFLRLTRRPQAISVMLVPAGGGRERLIAHFRGPRAFVGPLQWSPRSNLVIASATAGLLGFPLAGDPHVIVPASENGSAVEAASFSPRGDRIAYALHEADGTDIHIVGIDGAGERPITTDRRSHDPVWGPERIAFARLDRQAWDIWTTYPDGTGRRRLTFERMPITPVAWSGDGLRLLAARVEEGATSLLAIDGTTGFVRTLEASGDDAVPLALSHDGRAVLATASCRGTTDGNGVLLTVPFAGGPPRVVARGACRASWNA